MEQGDAPSTEPQAKPEDEPLATSDDSTYVWQIRKIKKYKGGNERLYSDEFHIGSYTWRLLCFPRGNQAQFLSVYLDAPEAAFTPLHMSPKVSFTITVHNRDPDKSFSKEGVHIFTAKQHDWGFTSMIPLSEAYHPGAGFLAPNGSITISAHLRIHAPQGQAEPDDPPPYVGLAEEGAAGYKQLLLLSLFHMPCFRQAVLHMSDEAMDGAANGVPGALQRLFQELESASPSASTTRLNQLLGGPPQHCATQGDANELSRAFLNALQTAMQGTGVDECLQELFEGTLITQLEDGTTRSKPFSELRLDVKECEDFLDSFNKLHSGYTLAGHKRLVEAAEAAGSHEAAERCIIQSGIPRPTKLGRLPPMLRLCLKRFEYDAERNITTRVNKHYMFREEFHVAPHNCGPEVDISGRDAYVLHTVLVHRSNAQGGHYSAFIRLADETGWLMFDGQAEIAKVVDSSQAVVGQRGEAADVANADPDSAPATAHTAPAAQPVMETAPAPTTVPASAPITSPDSASGTAVTTAPATAPIPAPATPATAPTDAPDPAPACVAAPTPTPGPTPALALAPDLAPASMPATGPGPVPDPDPAPAPPSAHTTAPASLPTAKPVAPAPAPAPAAGVAPVAPAPAPASDSTKGTPDTDAALHNSPPTIKADEAESAFQLVYIRRSEWRRVMFPACVTNTQPQVSNAKPQDQKAGHANEGVGPLYCTVQVVTKNTMADQIGHTTYFDLLDWKRLPNKNVFSLRKDTPFFKFKHRVAAFLDVRVARQRYWTLAPRPSGDGLRLDRCLHEDETEGTLVHLHKLRDLTDSKAAPQQDTLFTVRLFLDDSVDQAPRGALRPGNAVLLFIKSYDPLVRELRFEAPLWCPKTATLSDLLPTPNHRWRREPDGINRVTAFVEVRHEPTLELKMVSTSDPVGSLQLHDGDILIVQLMPRDSPSNPALRTIHQYLDHVRGLRLVEVRRLDRQDRPGRTLRLFNDDKYSEVTSAVAALMKLHLHQSEAGDSLRLTGHNPYTDLAHLTPVAHLQGQATLHSMLPAASRGRDILYYEVVYPLAELEQMRSMQVTFVGPRLEAVCLYNVHIDGTTLVSDLVQLIQKNSPSEKYSGRPLRMMAVHEGMIQRVFGEGDGLSIVDDVLWSLRMEAIPPEELAAVAGSAVVPVCHCHPGSWLVAEPVEGVCAPASTPAVQLLTHQQPCPTNFGDPFVLLVRPDESLKEVKARIQARLDVPCSEFATWSVALVPSLGSGMEPQELQDDDLVLPLWRQVSRASKGHQAGRCCAYLGLMHRDTAPRRPHPPYRLPQRTVVQ